MRPSRLVDGEAVYLDMTAPWRTLFGPLCEQVIWTGICWALIGYIDRPAPIPAFLLERGIGTPNLHNALVGLWFLLFFIRFIIPLIRIRGQRFILSHRRIIYREGRRGATHDIDMNYVNNVARKGSTLYIYVEGSAEPVELPRIARAKKCESLIRESLV
ncbi:MAG: hypothetical protein Q3962_02075 [Corynebacterium sp.]|nr:hypothetical protein [Corynebacterium sp.]